MNSVEAFGALLNCKKIQALSWETNDYIYLKGNHFYDEEGNEDINGFYYLAEEDSWQEYVEPKKDKPIQNQLKMYLLFSNDYPMGTVHVVCASSKKEARKILAEYYTNHDYQVIKWLYTKYTSCKTLCNVSGNFKSLIPNSVIV